MKDLQREGMIVRRAGSGTYVAGREGGQGHVFGLLIPGLGETEIFETICQGTSPGAQARGHALLWGDTTYGNDEGQIAELCEYYIGRKVSGIFFAPLELRPDKDELNHWVLERLAKAHIPVNLLDRCIYPYPRRSSYDLIGIDIAGQVSA